MSDYDQDDQAPEIQVLPAAPRYRPNTATNTCTPDITPRVAGLVAQGLTIPVACDALGVKGGTWKGWSMTGRKHAEQGIESVYTAWNDAMRVAKAQAETSFVAKIVAGAETDWRAAAWVAERRFPKRWSQLMQAKQAEGESTDTRSKTTAELVAMLKGEAQALTSGENESVPVLNIKNGADGEKL